MSDAKLELIRKLLTQAEDPAVTDAEAEAFTAKAMQLMAEYGIDEAMLAAAQKRDTRVADLILDFRAPYARDKCSMAGSVAHALRCRPVVRRRGNDVSVHVFGVDADLAFVEMLVTSLLVQASHELGRTPIPRGEHAAAFRRSWWHGYSAAIYQRLIEIEKGAVAHAEAARADGTPSTTLVLANQELAVQDAMNEAYPTLKSASRRRLSGRGMGAGFESGQRADLSMSNQLTH